MSGERRRMKGKARLSGEHWRRSLVKTVSYRVLILLIDFFVVLLFTGSVTLAIGAAATANIIKSVTYFGHERVWNAVRWGRK